MKEAVVLEAFVNATVQTMASPVGKKAMKTALLKGASPVGAIIVCFGIATKVENFDVALQVSAKIQGCMVCPVTL